MEKRDLREARETAFRNRSFPLDKVFSMPKPLFPCNKSGDFSRIPLELTGL